jgi:beta-N-acetylhexosaminidase
MPRSNVTISAGSLAVLTTILMGSVSVSADELVPPRAAPASASAADSPDAVDIAEGIASLRSVDADQALLARMIGQMIMVGFSGEHERDEGVALVREQLARGDIGGVVLYPKNIHGPRELCNLTAFLANANSVLVPLIGVDQEGGLVQRLTRRKGYIYFPSARSVGRNLKLMERDGALHLYESMARELARAGINVNFGPVVDLAVSSKNPVIVQRKRSFGSDPSSAIVLGRAFILAHREQNIVTAAKHFPGHGSSQTDSHKDLPDISKTWREKEIEPYRALAREGLLDMVMMGHLYHPTFSDGANVPASLSGRGISALRSLIHFDGVVVSDDLEMGAVAHAYPLEERLVMAINAGTDLLVYSNMMTRDPGIGRRIHALIADAVRDGRIPRARIEQAYGRIMLLKRRLAQHDVAGKW